jgi:hypothetical protein
MVQKQAAIIAFLDAFTALAVVFGVLTSLLWPMKKPQHHDDQPMAAAE